MKNTIQGNYLEDENPIDIINHNISKLSALKMLLTDDDISLRLSDITSGLYFLLSDIKDQLKYALQVIEVRTARRHSTIS